MYPELVTGSDLTCSCRRSAARPSTSSATPAIWPIPIEFTARVHDECNGSGRVRLRHLYVPAISDARH